MKQVFCWLWLVVGAVPALAADAPTQVVARVAAKYQSVQVIEAQFVQTETSAAFGERVHNGTLVLKRPNKMVWDFATTGQQFISNGKTLWVYTPKTNQVLRMSDTTAVTQVADIIFQSLNPGQTQFKVEQIEQSANQTVLAFTPKTNNPLFERFQVAFDANYLLTSMTFTDAADTTIRLDLTQVQLNAAIPDSRFEFVVPPGAEVIDH